jgi:riboflavin kinase / FMN adenylyltransferase
MTRAPTAAPAPLLPLRDRGAIVTVGTFDGVHRGHQEVLRALVERGGEAGRRTVVVTFHPHPLKVVRPEAAPPVLTSTPEKKLLLAGTGVQYALFLEFTHALQQYPARRFVEEILLGRLGMRELVIGHDHGFGRGREGSVDTMRELGTELGFGVAVIAPVRLGSEPISSSRARLAIEAGDLAEAARCLGRPYSLGGVVVHGEKRGRELGFPTANIQPDDADKLLPAPGIYAVHGYFRGERVPGLLHLGPRPTFPGLPPSVELYLLDWSGDLYGERVDVELRHRLREIRPFTGVEALVEQMRRDEAEGRALLLG